MQQHRIWFLSIVLLACSAGMFGDYSARLYFKNETTGVSGSGTVAAVPTDVISLNFSFHGGTNGVNRWSRLQIALDLYANPVLGQVGANTWNSSILAAFADSVFPHPIVWQPSNGPLYDSASSPGDTTSRLITPRGIYANIVVDTSKAPSKDIELKLFQFIAADSGSLDWKYPGRNTPNGISTRLIDRIGQTRDIVDNRLIVAGSPRLAGRVTFGGLAPGIPTPASITMLITPDNDSQYNQIVALTQDGLYSLPLSPGVYSISISVSHWLRRVASVDTRQGNTIADFILTNGDIQKDNRIDLLDLNVILVTFSSKSPASDLNGDSLVDLFDLNIVLANFGLVGD